MINHKSTLTSKHFIFNIAMVVLFWLVCQQLHTVTLNSGQQRCS